MDYKLEDFDHIECENYYFNGGDSGIRAVYKTKIKLWEEVISYGHPMLGGLETTYTVFPDKLPDSLPNGAIAMGEGDDYFGNFIDFGNNALDAFIYAEQKG